MLHQISIYLTLSLNKFYQKSARKSTASGITHEKPSDVVILSAPREEERGSDEQCERFGHGDGEPDAVDAEKFWQKKHRDDLKDERAQERNERAGCAIVEPREKRRTEDIETADEE